MCGRDRSTSGHDNGSVASELDIIEAVCRLPLEARASGRSHVDLIERIGYVDRRPDVTVARLRACLAEHPELIDAWQGWVEDNRSTPAWFFRDAPRGRFEVGLLARDGGVVEQHLFDERAHACAEYMVRELDMLAAIARKWRPWRWIRRRIRQVAGPGGPVGRAGPSS
jgi:hypothetical protein